MIELGFHTDNWRPLSMSFEASVEKGLALGLRHVEFAAIHGQNFIQAMGYDPGISLQSNARALKRYLDGKGVAVSQIDGAYPLMGPQRFDVWRAVRAAGDPLCGRAGLPERGHDGRRVRDRGPVARGGVPHHVRQLPSVPVVGGGLRRDAGGRTARPVHERRRLHAAAVRPLRFGVPAVQHGHGQQLHRRARSRCSTASGSAST